MTAPATPARLAATEYLESPTALRDAARETGLSRRELVALFSDASDRLRRELALPAPPVEIRGDGILIANISGLLRLHPRLEIEIAPKFLGTRHPRWRDDFFQVALLSRHGRVLPAEALRAGYGSRGDLATLVGRAIVALYWQHHRRPLRVYRRQVWRDFSLDGDADPEQILENSPDGIEQTGLLLARSNVFNSQIQEAVRMLLSEVRDVETRRQLVRVYEALAPQVSVRRPGRLRRLPNRHRRWEVLYDLACRVVQGFGLTFTSPGHVFAPGFVIDTVRAWEDLLFSALRAGVSQLGVRSQHPFRLGTRGREVVTCTPDVTIETQPGAFALVDAKYKSRIGRDRPRIAAADLYESLAFLEAARSRSMILVYPASPTDSEAKPCGAVSEFDRVVVGDRQVVALAVECRGLSETRGFERFASRLAEAVVAISRPVPVTSEQLR